MAYKTWSWLPTWGRFALIIKASNELWYYSRRDGSEEKQHHLLFVGWYEVPRTRTRLFTINVLWLSLQVGVIDARP